MCRGGRASGRCWRRAARAQLPRRLAPPRATPTITRSFIAVFCLICITTLSIQYINTFRVPHISYTDLYALSDQLAFIFETNN